MPTQEERLSTLERTITTLQKKFDDADIQSVNHNATMLLGLAYGQRGDIREIKAKLEEHTTTLEEHRAILNEHTKILNQHTATLNEHTARFDRLEGLLAQILERLPK